MTGILDPLATENVKGGTPQTFAACLEDVLQTLSAQVSLASSCLSLHPSPPPGYEVCTEQALASLKLAVSTFRADVCNAAGGRMIIELGAPGLADLSLQDGFAIPKGHDAWSLAREQPAAAIAAHEVTFHPPLEFGPSAARPVPPPLPEGEAEAGRAAPAAWLERRGEELRVANANSPNKLTTISECVVAMPSQNSQGSERSDVYEIEPHSGLPLEIPRQGSSRRGASASGGGKPGPGGEVPLQAGQGSGRSGEKSATASERSDIYEVGPHAGFPLDLSMQSSRRSGRSSIDDSRAFDPEEDETALGRCTDGVINPNWVGKLAWDFTVIALVLIDAMVLPFQMAYKHGREDDVFDQFWLIVTTSAFGADIVGNFFTGYVAGRKDAHAELGSLVTNRVHIIRHYLRSWFSIDLVATVPWSTLAGALLGGDGSSDSAQVAKLTKVVKFFRFLRLVRMLRLAKLGVIWERIEAKLGSIILLQIIALVRVLFLVITICHWNACIWWMIGQPRSLFTEFMSDEAQQEFADQPHWTTMKHRQGFDGIIWSWNEKENTEAYVFCFYWTLGVMRTMPAEVQPVNLLERVYVMLFMFFAVSAFAISVTLITQAFLKIGERKRMFNEDMALARMHLRNIHANEGLQRRVKTYLAHLFEKRRIQAKEVALLGHLPSCLRNLMRFSNVAVHLRKLPILATLPKRRLFAISEACEIQDVAPGEQICKSGRLAESAYVRVSGRLQAINCKFTEEGGVLETVDEECLATRRDVLSSQTVGARGCAEVASVSKKKFFRLLDEDHELALLVDSLFSRQGSVATDSVSLYRGGSGPCSLNFRMVDGFGSEREEPEDFGADAAANHRGMATTAGVVSAA
mmetsp:Transcript_126780/g.370586  ORF Transcript_126780/g.370586 Transcript_126780/m.370586 type:complete len:860 (+) Transcript_126780:105-2684(+)